MPGYLTAVISTNVNEGAVEGAIEGAIKGVTEGVKNRLIALITKTYATPGIKSIELQEIFNVSERTILSDVKKLDRYLEYKGNKKTSGYFFKDAVKQLVHREKA